MLWSKIKLPRETYNINGNMLKSLSSKNKKSSGFNLKSTLNFGELYNFPWKMRIHIALLESGLRVLFTKHLKHKKHKCSYLQYVALQTRLSPINRISCLIHDHELTLKTYISLISFTYPIDPLLFSQALFHGCLYSLPFDHFPGKLLILHIH